MKAQLILVIVAAVLTVPALHAQDVDFDTEVKPILKASCYKCHGAKRQRGKLRLDHWSDAFTKGDHALLVPGKPEKSELLRRATLEEDDPDFMPKDGEPLTKSQLATLQKWIAGGAKWPAGKAAGAESEARWRSQFAIPELTEPQKAAQAKAIAAVRKAGGLANRIAADTPAIDVNLSLIGKDVNDDTLAALSGLETSLVWLNLSRTKVSDGGLGRVATHTHLRRLHLARTGVGDAGLGHLQSLKGLRYLNLYGTSVGDAGLEHLQDLKELEKVFLWQTKVTDAGVKKLQAALPDCAIDVGKYAKPVVHAPKAMPKPINATCPITNKAVDGTCSVEHQGQLIAFCCGNCLASFKKEPGKWLPKIEEFKKK